MLTSKIIKETIEILFKFEFDIPRNYLWCCYEKDTFDPVIPLFERSARQCHRSPASLLTTINSHYLPKCLRSTAKMRQNACYRNLKRTLEDLLPCHCHTVKTSSKTTRSQVRQPASPGEGAHMCELQAHHCMTPEQCTWLLCRLSVIPAKKLSLQEINQFNAIELLTSSFLENFGS